ncbi:MAG: bifunctional phosphoribosyl-AMP cyclohydrolase/phosphoribosyl-ATP diphosphatase HisIE [Clostridiales bacterium]|nr:bifunctional phosphoribosyl-AMP cyclohydrolase/phosphoribosyl-ATP diphosphatase HisIE [Clostridiales bacterium]MBS5877140.1 bifunctional phosphoribosyl-AMP cyclohydrolase/phosphoribosyl-ATP diphosphatase HisIE [Clostridiales bacterium]
MSVKKFIPRLFIKDEEAYKDITCTEKFSIENDPAGLAAALENNGADGIIFYDLSGDDISHEKNITLLRKITKEVDIPVIAGGNVKRLEDIKKYLYAGAKFAIVDLGAADALTGEDLVVVGGERFGRQKMVIRSGDGTIYIENDGMTLSIWDMEECTDGKEYLDILKNPSVYGLTGKAVSSLEFDIFAAKRECSENGIEVKILRANVDFSELIANDQGLVPVIVQDYKTDEVLMMAWMNEEAYENTINTGKMTYFSRSREGQWVKGETSGHFQYIRSMSVDCDKDTLLAKVKQIGAACHTGNRTCFYTDVFEDIPASSNPLNVFTDVYDLIEDRKINPKEGSYTNYLFTKGIDKILKKCGEEASEIIIAAKNPDPEEIKYEVADFLYHLMVLMSLKGITWEDIVKELANR